MENGIYNVVNGHCIKISQDLIYVDKLIFTDEFTFIRNGQTIVDIGLTKTLMNP